MTQDEAKLVISKLERWKNVETFRKIEKKVLLKKQKKKNIQITE